MINNLFYIESLKQKKQWFIFHAILGLISLVSNLFLITWFYLILFSGIVSVFNARVNSKKTRHLFYLLIYLAPFEMLARMVNCSPFIPYEIGKYLTFILLLWGLAINQNSYKLGYLVVALCIPGIFIGWPMAPDYRYIIFNVMGVINFGLAVALFGCMNINQFDIKLMNVVRLLIYPLLTALLYAFLRTPDYDDMTYELGANSDASGGFGSNQVSTAFGLGMFLTFYLWYNKYVIFGMHRTIDIGITMLFFFQGLLTFSRGGIIGGVLAIILLIVSGTDRIKSLQTRKAIVRKSVLFAMPLIILVLFFANSLSKGNLFLRYQGETHGTLVGVKEKTLNTITTGRYEIFLGDLEIFLDNPILGVGVNASRYVRDYANGVVAHVELSRMLAEHGLLGIILFGVFLFVLIKSFRNRQRTTLLFLFAVIGFYTTFHAATRTFISPLLMGLAFLNVNSSKRNLFFSKKQL